MANTLEDVISHSGVLGMKWGVRNEESVAREERSDSTAALTTKLKNGGSLIINKDPHSKFVQFLSRHSEKYKDGVDKFHSFTMKNEKGQKVGDCSFVQDTPTSLYLNWITVKNGYRGNGYASAAMKGVVKYSKENGINTLKLEVPGNAPDARHIYEKLGFKVSTSENDVLDEADSYWGGLTTMYMDIPHDNLAHSDLTDIYKYIIDSLNEMPEEETDEELLGHSEGGVMADTAEDVIAHSGVLGMHWGKHLPGRTEESHNRKPIREPHDDHVKAHGLERKSISSLSNSELQTLNQRLQLEQTYSKLKSNTGTKAKIKQGNDSVKTVLAVGTSITGLVALGKTASLFLRSEAGQKAIAAGARAVGKIIVR